MEIFEKIPNIENKDGCVLALGNFDGVHIGHIHLLNSAAAYAKEKCLSLGVYTFIDSPKFQNPKHSLLTDLQTRISFIEYKPESSPDFLFLERFSLVKKLSASEFVNYIIEKFNCKCAFCGENFRFGANASGNSTDLKYLMNRAERDTIIVESVFDEDEVVSSTLIKSLLEKGDCIRAERLLSEPFGFSSEVVHGAHLGHRLGFPTVNQIVPKSLIYPAFGVYATIVIVDGKEYMGVTNFGVKPTVSGDTSSPVAETHIIDFDGDIYGEKVGIYFCKMLREEKKFSSLEELKQNIAQNVIQTKEFFKVKHEKV